MAQSKIILKKGLHGFSIRQGKKFLSIGKNPNVNYSKMSDAEIIDYCLSGWKFMPQATWKNSQIIVKK